MRTLDIPGSLDIEVDQILQVRLALFKVGLERLKVLFSFIRWFNIPGSNHLRAKVFADRRPLFSIKDDIRMTSGISSDDGTPLNLYGLDNSGYTYAREARIRDRTSSGLLVETFRATLGSNMFSWSSVGGLWKTAPQGHPR